MFARKLSYMAHNSDDGGQFVALLELVDLENGVEKAHSFVLYRYLSYCEILRADMIEVSSKEKAEKLFPFAFGEIWQKTTNWLYKVSVGGALAMTCKGDLIDVGNRPIREKQKMRRLEFGSLLDILNVRRVEKSYIENKIRYLPDFPYDDEDELDRSNPRVANFLAEKADLEEELQVREATIDAILREIEYLEQKNA